MKKNNRYLLILFTLGVQLIQAKPITPTTAKNIASTFYKQHSQKQIQNLTLAYTETSSASEVLYYVFNINTNDGFVIVTADDAAHPIIGYSTENQFVIPTGNSNFGYWMNNRKKEIMSIKAANLKATNDISREWAGDFSASRNLTNASQRTSAPNSVTSTSSYTVGTYLAKTTWNQNGGGSVQYNNLCPGSGNNKAVTGCVATAMAQIMKFWNYPTHGIGSSSYCDCTANGFTVNNGNLTANYATTTYSWSTMPLASSNLAVATLMYDCGVSVDMDYSPTGSGAQVLAVDAAGASAQTSYTNYFGYDANTIVGYKRTEGGFSDSVWISLIENDINAGRPVQYAGQDPSDGGHTWVCDGYDNNNNLHMNWGWGGASNGFFSINNLATPGFNPSTEHEILVGIQPPPNYDAGIASITSPVGDLCVSTFTPVTVVRNYGATKLTSCTINYQLDGGSVMTHTWTGSLATNQSATVTLAPITSTFATHTLTCFTTLPNDSTDADTANNLSSNIFIISTTGSPIPFTEGFEGSSNLPFGWAVKNTNADATWQVITNVAHTGSNCVGMNNCDGDGGTNMTGRKDYLYTTLFDFSSSTSGSMSFDVGYVPAYDSDSSKAYTDTLAVLYSIDCGATWTQVYKKWGSNLATAPSFSISSTSTVNCVAPTSSQWRTDAVNLTAVVGQPAVMFAFENVSDWGNWIYIDNINISNVSSLGIKSVKNDDGISIYPNPAHTNLYINTTENTSSISVTDILGQTVIADQKMASQQTNSIDISNLADGVYLVKVNSSDNQVKVIRFIKN